MLSCAGEESETRHEGIQRTDTPAATAQVQVAEDTVKQITRDDSLLFVLKRNGLSDVQEVDSTIAVDLKYSGRDNFLQQDVYGDLNRAFLQKDVAAKLALASGSLRKEAPGYTLVIFDAVRPRSVQQKMWDLLKMPVAEKIKYVSNPAQGSLHNYGAAVDVSILDREGQELDMGTPYDYFGVLAWPEKEDSLLKAGELKRQQIKNRQLLRRVMYKAGFFNIQTEWWHFNSCTRDSARARYRIIE